MEGARASKEEEIERTLAKFAAHETAREAVESLPPGEGLRMLRELHSAGKATLEEEVARRQEEFAQVVDGALEKSPGPPFADEFVAALIGLARTRVMPELFPKMEEVTRSLRAKLAGQRIEDEAAAMAFHMAVGNLSLEFHGLLQRELSEECKSRDVDVEKFIEQALPMLTGDFSFFAELSHLHALANRERLCAAAPSRDAVTRYVRRSNAYSGLLLKGRVGPQTAMVFPNIVEVFLFNEFGVEFVAVEGYVADFLAALPAQPTAEEQAFLELLFEEVFLCQKVQELLLSIGQSQAEMMAQMFGGEDGAGLSPEQAAHMQQMFNPENMERMKEMMGSMDVSKLQEMMPDMARLQEMMPEMGQFMQAMGAGGLPPFPPR